MSRHALAAVAAAVIALAGGFALAQKKAPPSTPEAVCPCPDAAPAPPLRESAFADCRDGVDNDGDGHVDCADQDCGIYAMCISGTAAAAPAAEAAAPAQPPTEKTYTTMRELKRDLRAKVISGRDFLRWQRVIRLNRKADFERAAAEYHAGSISRGEYRARIAEIKAKYEG